MDDLISRLSELRCQYNCFDENERDAYHTLSEAIKALSDVPDTNIGDTINRQAAIDAVAFGIIYAKAFDKETGEVKELFAEGNYELKKAIDRIKELPSVDAVEVVRCKDCKYYNHEEDEWNSESCNHPLFDVSDPYECYVLRVEPDDFCSRGERRTNEGEKTISNGNN